MAGRIKRGLSDQEKAARVRGLLEAAQAEVEAAGDQVVRAAPQPPCAGSDQNGNAAWGASHAISEMGQRILAHDAARMLELIDAENPVARVPTALGLTRGTTSAFAKFRSDRDHIARRLAHEALWLAGASSEEAHDRLAREPGHARLPATMKCRVRIGKNAVISARSPILVSRSGGKVGPTTTPLTAERSEAF